MQTKQDKNHNHNHNQRKTADWLLERVALDSDQGQGQGQGQSQDQDKVHLDAIKKSNEEILKNYPPDEMVNQIRAKMEKREKAEKRSAIFSIKEFLRKIFDFKLWSGLENRGAYKYLIAGVGCLCAIILMTPQQESDGVRIKGLKPSLSIYRKNGEAIEKLDQQMTLKEHDILQISFIPANYKYGVIASVDGRGNITLHYPDSLNLKTPGMMNSSKETVLSHAYELDDSPNFERFYFVTAHQSFDVALVLEKIKNSWTQSGDQELVFGENIVATSIEFKK